MEIKRLFPNASRDTINLNSPVSGAEPECNKALPLGRSIQRKAKGVRRISVCFTQYRAKLLDDDATGNPCKDLLDGLRHAGLIPGDDPGRIRFSAQQEKVAHRSQQKTVIEIEY